jgi:hypothetical protein
METIPTINEVLQDIQHSLKAPKSQFNEFGKYKYRNSEDILESLKPLLAKYKACVTINDEIVLIGDRYYVKATVTLSYMNNSISTSAFARESLDKKGMDDSQITGSTSSYARKYALNGMFAIDDTKDSDTTNTHESNEKQEPKKNPVKATVNRVQPNGNGEQLTVKQIVIKMGKELFKTPDEFKAWRIDNNLAELLDKANDYEVSKILLALKDKEVANATHK